jgi:hypothetical protein
MEPPQASPKQHLRLRVRIHRSLPVQFEHERRTWAAVPPSALAGDAHRLGRWLAAKLLAPPGGLIPSVALQDADGWALPRNAHVAHLQLHDGVVLVMRAAAPDRLGVSTKRPAAPAPLPAPEQQQQPRPPLPPQAAPVAAAPAPPSSSRSARRKAKVRALRRQGVLPSAAQLRQAKQKQQQAAGGGVGGAGGKASPRKRGPAAAAAHQPDAEEDEEATDTRGGDQARAKRSRKVATSSDDDSSSSSSSSSDDDSGTTTTTSSSSSDDDSDSDSDGAPGAAAAPLPADPSSLPAADLSSPDRFPPPGSVLAYRVLELGPSGPGPSEWRRGEVVAAAAVVAGEEAAGPDDDWGAAGGGGGVHLTLLPVPRSWRPPGWRPPLPASAAAEEEEEEQASGDGAPGRPSLLLHRRSLGPYDAEGRLRAGPALFVDARVLSPPAAQVGQAGHVAAAAPPPPPPPPPPRAPVAPGPPPPPLAPEVAADALAAAAAAAAAAVVAAPAPQQQQQPRQQDQRGRRALRGSALGPLLRRLRDQGELRGGGGDA